MNELILDVNENPKKKSQWFIFALQHLLAMLVACITVPLIINKTCPGANMPLSATLISSGIGTLIYIFLTRKKSPVFLSSSFAYISPMISALSVGLIGNQVGYNYLALILGMIFVGVVYVIVSIIIKFVGSEWLNKILPPLVVGPVIMVIGLSLSSSAINNLVFSSGSNQNYNLIALLCGLITLIITAMSSFYGKRVSKLIPFVIGLISGYVIALCFTIIGELCNIEYLKIINFSPLIELYNGKNIQQILLSTFNFELFVPNSKESFMFLRFDQIKSFDIASIFTILMLFVPVSFVTICEHIGDHLNLSNIINHDLFNEVGLKRTLLGDGIATGVSGVLSGAANTTYGENIAVIGITKIASVDVIILAAILTILTGFIRPITAFLETIPSCICGGISVLLYGFIASSGVKVLIKNKVDFNNNKNLIVISSILVTGIGGLVLKFGNINKPVIEITSVAFSMIIGILLNIILKDKNNKNNN